MSKMSFILGCFVVTILGLAASAQDSEKGSSSPKPPTFQVPRGWKALDAGSVSSARFQIGEGDRIVLVTITALPGDGGGLSANINRWRAQLGLEALPEKDVLKSVQPIKVVGSPGHSLDLTGPDAGGKPTPRLLAVIVKPGDQTWFFKLTGPSRQVAEQKAAFDGFMKSIRFEK